MDAAVAWLSRAFGLHEREPARFLAPDGRRQITEMQLGAGLVMLGRAGVHDLQSPEDLGGRNQMVMAYVADVDAHFSRAKTEGARIQMELADMPWGDRRYEALDAEGHRWYFATRVRDVAPEDWKQAVGGSG